MTRMPDLLRRLRSLAPPPPGVSLVLSLVLVLPACGFHLRGTGGAETSLSAVHIDAPAGALTQALTSTLVQLGVDVNGSQDNAPTLALSRERNARRVGSTGGRGTVAEYELSMQVDLWMTTPAGEVLIPRATIAVERVYRFDQTSALGSSEEEALLLEEMRRSLSDRIVQRVTLSAQHASKSATAGTQ